MIDILVVSEFNTVKELLRSALKMQPNIASITLSRDNDLRIFKNQYCFNSKIDIPDVILYDLDSVKEAACLKMDRMVDAYASIRKAKHGMPSLIVLSSEQQLVTLRNKVTFIDDSYIIKKPFTFKQVIQVVNNVWTSNFTH